MTHLPEGVKELPVPRSIQPVAWLLGKWRCEKAYGSYPTIQDFTYGEEIAFWNVGQPMLNYNSFSWHTEKFTPMHQEFGFLRLKPESQDVSLLVTHNFGLTTVEEGQIGDIALKFESRNIGRMSFAKDPNVLKLVREFSLEGEKLKQVIFMATTNTPLTKHLEAVYEKKTNQ
ncbi:peroxynitrite isomerase THAP4-like [Tigriopus californicus]|uniref:peroxynitrite isomerase THAP4-like n=1 Tax=Tigriopus californicus TaxID=6832 RepID=UPI0027D9DCB9|nr:peroxynitrite isomerase THAP4-like [Tigriopus californicus]